MADTHHDRDFSRRSEREWDDRRYGGYANRGERDWRGDRIDHGIGERMGDEVRSWFGDDDAERRREMDERRDYDQSYRRSYHNRDQTDYGWRGVGREGQHTDDYRGDRSSWSDHHARADREHEYGRSYDSYDDREQWERGRRRFDGVTRPDFDASRREGDRSVYSNPRDEWNERDRGYERVYRAEHGRPWGPGGYSRADDAPWSTRGPGGTSGMEHGSDGSRYGHTFRDRDIRDREDRSVFERAGDEVRSWFGDDDAERRRREDARRERRSGGRFDDHPATDRSSDTWW